MALTPRTRAAWPTQFADAVFISPTPADHHIQHIYNKVGVSTGAAVALWAAQHGVV